MISIDMRKRSPYYPVMPPFPADAAPPRRAVRARAGESEPVSRTPRSQRAVWAIALLWLAGIAPAAPHAGQAAGFQPASNTADADKKLASLSGVAVGSGAPVVNATVTLTMVFTTGGPISVTSARVPVIRTDAAGKFSFERLAPGSYMLRVAHPAYLPAIYGARDSSSGGTTLTLTEGQQMTGVTVKLVMPATVSGRVVDEDGDPYPHGNVQILRLVHFNGRPQVSQVAKADSGDDGKFKVEGAPPGRFYLRVGPQPTWTVSDRAPVAAVKPGQKDLRPNGTYLGGTTEWAGATVIEVGPAQTIPMGDIKILNDTWIHVRGKVIGDPALLQGARVIRMPREPTGLLPWSYGADIQKDGSYDLAHVWSGGFTLTVMNMRGQYFGWTPIVASHEDLEGVVINAAAAPLSGSVKIEGEDQAAPAAAGAPLPRRGTVSLASAEGATVIRAAGMVKPDGSFTIPILAPGKYIADVTGLPAGSYVKSLRVGGVEVLNATLDWGGSDNRTLEAVISAKAAVLEGVVQDDDGKPMPDSAVTLVPVPLRFGHARLYPTVKSDQQGHFRFASVTPGAYKVYAWEEIEDTAHWDPNYVRPFESLGGRVELDEGGHATVNPKRISAAVMQEALSKVGL